MRVFYLGNNWLGWQVLEWLKRQNSEIVGVAVHPEGQRKHAEEIIAASGVQSGQVFDASKLNEPAVLDGVRRLMPDIGVSVMLGFILRSEFLGILPQGCINVHPALLPYNRGANPNVWSIVDGTPAGVTIHYINDGIDTGDTLSQREVPVAAVDTGATLYHKLEEAALALFQETWPKLSAGTLKACPQAKGCGSVHRLRDLERLDELDLERTYTGREIINILRARTFPPYQGAFFRDRGRKVFIQVSLSYEDDARK
jgi:methionyl-tRNA formyltransferase